MFIPAAESRTVPLCSTHGDEGCCSSTRVSGRHAASTGTVTKFDTSSTSENPVLGQQMGRTGSPDTADRLKHPSVLIINHSAKYLCLFHKCY